MSHNHVKSAKHVISMKCKTNDNYASVCIKCACGVHMWCICKAWLSTFWSKCVKHRSNDQNMINQSNHGNPQSLELIGVQNNTKMPFGHFIKHLVCTYKTNMWAMHKHEWNLPKYMLKFPQLANTITNKPNGTKPNHEIERIFTKLKVSQPFSRITHIK